MKQAKMLEFIKRWKALERDLKNIDYNQACLCADIRAEFPSGAMGDKAFRSWMSLELGIPVERQEESLSRAAAFLMAADQHEWDALGGWRQIRILIPLSKQERVAVIGAAKASGYRIGTVVRQRESKPITHGPTPDIVLLAEFIESLSSAPDDLREIARKYVRARALKVAS